MRALALALFLLLPTDSIAAQWHAALSRGVMGSAGFSRQSEGGDALSFLPDHPSSWVLSIGHDVRSNRIALELRHTDADLALRGASTAIITRNALHAWGAALEGAHRIAGNVHGPALLIALGAQVDRWTFDLGESDPRTRASARAALEADVPMNQRWSGLFRGEVTVGSSIFTNDELPDGYQRKLGKRFGIVVGIRRQW